MENQGFEPPGSKAKRKSLTQCIKAMICVYMTVSVLTFGLYCTIPSGKILLCGEEYKPPFYSADSSADIVLDGSSKDLTADVSLFDSFRLCSAATGSYTVDVTAMGFIPIKTMQVSVIPEKYLVPDGRTVGIKLNTGGITVVSISEEEAAASVREAGIQCGDIITAINDVGISNSQTMRRMVDECGGKEIKLTVKQNGKTKDCYVTPTPDGSGGYRLGLWLRDGVSGIGTLTYYDPESGSWAALGHGISEDGSTSPAEAKSGQLLPAGVVSVEKSTKGEPGEIRGYICEEAEQMGTVQSNTSIGVYGTSGQKDYFSGKALKAAKRSEVKEGKATILAAISDSQPESYEISIEKVYRNTLFPGKGMLIKITDKRLLDETGGIVQGMSGCPIIQDNKIVGAITHVLVKDPAYGYGIFIDSMIERTQTMSQ